MYLAGFREARKKKTEGRKETGGRADVVVDGGETGRIDAAGASPRPMSVPAVSSHAELLDNFARAKNSPVEHLPHQQQGGGGGIGAALGVNPGTSSTVALGMSLSASAGSISAMGVADPLGGRPLEHNVHDAPPPPPPPSSSGASPHSAFLGSTTPCSANNPPPPPPSPRMEDCTTRKNHRTAAAATLHRTP